MPTGEDAATAEDRYAPTTTTGGTEEPGPLPAKVAGGLVEIDGVAFILPVFAAAAVAIGENHPVLFSANADRSDYFAMP